MNGVQRAQSRWRKAAGRGEQRPSHLDEVEAGEDARRLTTDPVPLAILLEAQAGERARDLSEDELTGRHVRAGDHRAERARLGLGDDGLYERRRVEIEPGAPPHTP